MMMTTVGIDLAKTVFQIHGENDHGKAVDEDLLRYLSTLVWEHINLTGDYLWHSSTKNGGAQV